jgi:hypothetical protein
MTDFAKNASRKDGLQTACRFCQANHNKASYGKRRDYYIRKNKELRDRNRAAIFEYLKTHPCVDCGNTNPVVLTFDHVRGKKTLEIANMVRGSWGLDNIFKEIKKCDVRCFNCHMIKDSKRYRNLESRLVLT